MSMELGVMPSGRLHPYSEEFEESPSNVGRALEREIGAGLFALAGGRDEEGLTPSLRYWREFAGMYMTERCHVPETGSGAIESVKFPLEFPLESFLKKAPPMRGLEYLSDSVLLRAWGELDGWLCDAVNEQGGKLGDYLKKRAPRWHQVGRVCFHLAENKNDPAYPFAFMATYTPELSGVGRALHKPLGRALEEYAGAKNKKGLVNLLSPVELAAQGSELVRTLADKGDIYHPLAWKPEDAYLFLKEIRLYEESGIVVKVPDWWRKRPRPRVSVTVDGPSRKNFSADSLLSFDIKLALGDQVLSAEERRRLAEAEDGLLLLKGRWVEVDREKLKSALAHWENLEEANRDEGISFIDGMRLLAGAASELTEELSEEEQDWVSVQSGKALGQILDELRQPEAIKAALPGKALKATLRPYQEVGVNWLWFLTQLKMGVCLADDMGLGKTIQVIALLLILKRKRSSKPSLLVLPASLLGNWKDEIERFAPSLKCLFVHPSLKVGKERPGPASVEGRDLVLTTYGMLSRETWLLEEEWRLVILDEAQAVKNPGARQTKAVKKLMGESRIALTGTPVENRLGDLWSLFDFLSPGLLGTATAFKAHVKSLDNGKAGRYAPLRNLVSPYIMRRLKTDKSIINDLPDKTETNAYCGLSKTQAALYKKSVQELDRGLKGVDGIQRRGLVLSYLLRFKQICNHPSQLLGDGAYEPAKSGKFERLAELCEEIASRQEKALIFTQYREMTGPLAVYLEEFFGRPGLVLHGGTGVKKRKELVDKFQDEDGPPFFVLSIKAGGTGLNLTAASHVIHFDRWWNPAVENQATDRAFRIGQKKNVLVHKFICRGTVEEKIDELIMEKTALSGELLEGGGETLLTEMSDGDLMDLVSLDLSKI